MLSNEIVNTNACKQTLINWPKIHTALTASHCDMYLFTFLLLSSVPEPMYGLTGSMMALESFIKSFTETIAARAITGAAVPPTTQNVSWNVTPIVWHE